MGKQPHVLPNGFTFLAITAGSPGWWGKATDPITAIRNAHKFSGLDKNAIYVIYGNDDELYVSDYGGYNWKANNPPTPIGIFTVTNRSIKPTAKGDFNEKHADCYEWMIENIEHIEQCKVNDETTDKVENTCT